MTEVTELNQTPAQASPSYRGTLPDISNTTCRAEQSQRQEYNRRIYVLGWWQLSLLETGIGKKIPISFDLNSVIELINSEMCKLNLRFDGNKFSLNHMQHENKTISELW